MSGGIKIDEIHVGHHPITVTVTEGDDPATAAQVFTESFQIGRDEENEVRIVHAKVSRRHAEVFLKDGTWWIRDSGSTNGTFVNGKRIEETALEPHVEITLGQEGPRLMLDGPPADTGETIIFASPPAEPVREVVSAERALDTLSEPAAAATAGAPPPVKTPQAPPPVDPGVSYFIKRYFEPNEQAGEQTMMIRRAFQHVQKKERKKYTHWIIAAVGIGILALAFGTYKAIDHARQERKIREQQARIEELEGKARQIFYQMKQLELTIGPSPAVTQLKQQYASFVDELGTYDSKSDEEKLIYRMARMFGECDVDMPPGFADKVREYIGYWRSTGRYRQAIERARQNGYTYPIVRTFLEHDLPPQFFYLAMQESSFNVNAVGPLTRYGYAKGMWQFIEMTATRYKLQTGPLVFNARPDPLDDRHNFEKSTRAAAEYIRDIYVTDAQASGLLVFASYNWGEQNVLSLIRRLPENPRDRNFWKLLEKYSDRIPQETYNYVFYIFAAAVIGENPRLFGFDFDNPLSEPIRQVESRPAT